MNETLFIDKGSWPITFLASFLIWMMLAGLLILWFVDGRIKKKQALQAFLATALAWLVAEIVKSLIPSIRPFKIYGYSPLTFTIPSDNSFPSSHAAAAFAMAFTVLLHNKKIGAIFILGAILIGVGRILANVHYIFDILGGLGIGLVASIVIDRKHFKKSNH